MPLSDAAYDAVRRELVRGVAVGENPRRTAARMVARAEHQFNGGLARALTIARTETLDAYREAARVSHDANADLLSGWKWLADLSPRTCPACVGMHGTVHGLAEPGPTGHQQCRCSRMPVVKTWDELGFDGIDEPVDDVPDADEWFAGLSPLEQYELLGRDRYAAWAAGKYPRSGWAEVQHNDGWRDSHVPSKPPRVEAGAGAPPRPPSPPKSPAAGPSADDAFPPMGRVVGSLEQQRYVRAPAVLTGPFREDSADNWHTYVSDPEDRTTALLQYHKGHEELIKQIAADLTHNRQRSRQTSTEIVQLFRAINRTPSAGIGPGTYDLDDLKADLTGAAHRLLARPVETLDPVVYRALNLRNTPVDFVRPALAERVFELVRLDDWWFESATPSRDLAKEYFDSRRTRVMLEIHGAVGVRLTAMGRMAAAPEVLLGGALVNTEYAVVDGILWIRGEWQP